MVVQHCCNDDQQSRWEKLEFWPPVGLKPMKLITNWTFWLFHEVLPPTCQFLRESAQRVHPINCWNLTSCDFFPLFFRCLCFTYLTHYQLWLNYCTVCSDSGTLMCCFCLGLTSLLYVMDFISCWKQMLAWMLRFWFVFLSEIFFLTVSRGWFWNNMSIMVSFGFWAFLFNIRFIWSIRLLRNEI